MLEAARAEPDELAIVYVDDERPNLDLFRRLFDRTFRVVTASSGAEALQVLADVEAGVLVSDQRMPGMTGVELLAQAAVRYPRTTRMLLTAYSDRDLLLDAIQRGQVHDYLLKVWDAKDIRLRLHKGLEACVRRTADARAAAESGRLRHALARHEGDGLIVGIDGGLKQAIAAVTRASRGHDRVLFQGERGVGKELLARELHRRSTRSSGPFIALDGRADDLVEQLFGASGNSEDDAGSALEDAHRGTLYLAELSDCPPTILHRLFAALVAGRVERRGGGPPAPLDVRLVAGTSSELPALVQDQLPVRIEVPNLRTRPDDLEPLARHLLGRIPVGERRALHPSARALTAMREYRWPGNIDELRLVLERAALTESGDELECRDLLGAEASVREGDRARVGA